MDERFRELERAAASGDVAARIKLLRARAQAELLDPRDPRIGQELGGCWPEKVIAQGSGARYYLALHPEAGECCLRVFEPQEGLQVFAPHAAETVIASESEQEAAFLRAAHMWAQVDHPNLVIIHEVGTHSGQPFVRMLSNKRPFQANMVIELIRRVTQEEAPPLRAHDPALPEALEPVVAGSLRKQPADRPTAAALAEDLDRLLRSDA